MKKKKHILIGLLSCFLNLLWFCSYAMHWYPQEYAKVLVMFWYSPLMLYINMIGGVLGVLLGGFILFRKMKIADGIFINVNIFIMIKLISHLLY